jgi:hypothetical protein
MKPVYINNSHQQKAKAKGKIHPKYVQKTPIHTTRLEPIPEKVQWVLIWDDVTFRPGYYVGTPRLQRM